MSYREGGRGRSSYDPASYRNRYEQGGSKYTPYQENSRNHYVPEKFHNPRDESFYHNGRGTNGYQRYDTYHGRAEISSSVSASSSSRSTYSREPTSRRNISIESSIKPGASPVTSSSQNTPRHDPEREIVKRTYDDSLFSQQRHHLTNLRATTTDDNNNNTNDNIEKADNRPFKLMNDPTLKKDTNSKLEYRYDGENISNIRDPRRAYPVYPVYERHGQRSTKRPHSVILKTKFKYDKNSVGSKPTNEVVIWNYPITTPISHIKSNFRSFGTIQNIKPTDDPVTAVPLGLCVVSFEGEIEEAHAKAVAAVEKTNGRLTIGGSVVKCGLNSQGKLHKQIFQKMMDQRKAAARKEREKIRLRELETEKLHRQKEKSSHMEKVPKGPKNGDDVKPRSSPIAKALTRPLALGKGVEDTGLSLLSNIFSRDSKPSSSENSKSALKEVLSSHDRHIKESTSISLPTGYEKHINNRPFILIPDKYVSTRDVSSSDVRKCLIKYNCDRVLTHKTGFYVVFNDLKDAERCFDAEDGRTFMKYKMYMDFIVPQGSLSLTRIGGKLGVVGQAKSVLIRDHKKYLTKDLREKIVGPKLLACLENEKYNDILEKYKKEAKEKEEERKKLEQSLSSAKSLGSINPILDNPLLSSTVNHSGSVAGLSIFRRNLGTKKEPVNSKKDSKKKLVPMAHALNFQDESDKSSSEDEDEEDDEDEDDDEEDDEEEPQKEYEGTKERGAAAVGVEAVLATDKKRPALSSSPDHIIKKQKTANKSPDVSSADEKDERSMKDDEVSQPTTPEIDEMEVSSKVVSKKEDGKVKMEVEEEDEEEEEEVEEDNDVPMIDFSGIDIHYRPSTGIPVSAYKNDLKNMEYDLDCLQDVIKDDEDYELAKKCMTGVEDTSSVKDINYWSWKVKDIKINTKHLLNTSQLEESEKLFADLDVIFDQSLVNSTDSFKTEGYVKIQDVDKRKYLPHRRRVDAPLNTIQKEEDDTSATSNANANIHSSRVNRANNRRFAADISAQKQILGSETDILDLNHLTKRKKPVQFARSAIHNWGLYALEPIAAKEMIIEYVGERIRQQVAEVREKKYLKSGIGSSYLFRIDENTVIDASKKGGIARFINHCCIPSCTAKIIKVEGKKRIVIYALRDITANEELTYDYKFEREDNDDERIPCLCGAPGCKGYLN